MVAFRCDLLSSAASGAVPADLQARNQNAEAAISLYLLFESFESVAHKLRDLAAAQACHVNMIACQLALVVMPLAVDVHQIEFIDQALPFQQAQCAVDGAAVDGGIDPLRLAQNLGGIQMLARRLHHAQDGAPLLGHANSAFREMGLQPARHFGLWEWHTSGTSLVATGRNRTATNSSSGHGQKCPRSGILLMVSLDATQLQLK